MMDHMACSAQRYLLWRRPSLWRWRRNTAPICRTQLAKDYTRQLLDKRGVPGRTNMRIFVAGAGGALGTQVVRHLVADRHEVIGFTRSAAHAEVVQQLGVSRSITGDALNPSSIRTALEATRPEAVVHALTAIPKRGPWRASDLKQTNKLRITATKHLIDAAVAVGARQMVVESMIFIYGYGDMGPDWLNEETSAAKS